MPRSCSLSSMRAASMSLGSGASGGTVAKALPVVSRGPRGQRTPVRYAPMNRPWIEFVSGVAPDPRSLFALTQIATHRDSLLPQCHAQRSRTAVTSGGSRPARRSGRATRGSRGSPRRSNRRRPDRPPRPHRSRDAQPRGVLQRPTHSRCQTTIRRSAADHGRGAGRGRHVERERNRIPLAMGGIPAEVAARGTQAGRHVQRSARFLARRRRQVPESCGQQPR